MENTNFNELLLSAIPARHSVRQYIDKPIESDKVSKLSALVDECNAEGGLHIQLVTNEPKAFASGLAKYGKFSNVGNYLAMVGEKGADEKIGYYGEKIVLYAQSMGLNSCWVGLTFKNQPDRYTIGVGEKLFCLIALGYGEVQGVLHPQKKRAEEFYKDERSVKQAEPEWFMDGIRAAMLAPTAVNQQKFRFVLHDNDVVTASTTFSLFNGMGYASVDLGIVKLHFELASGRAI